MIRSSQALRSKTCRVLTHLPILVVLVSGGMMQHLSAQGPPAAPQDTDLAFRTVAGHHSSTARVGTAKVLRAALPRSAAFGVAPFGMQTAAFEPTGSDLADTAMGSADPFSRGAGFAASPALSNGAGDYATEGLLFGRQTADGSEGFRPGHNRAVKQRADSLFPLPAIFTRGLGGNAPGGAGSSLFSLATLTRMMRGDVYLPFGSSVGGLRFDYVDHVRPGPKMTGIGGGAASAMFTSTLMRNGMSFSAGALFGVRSSGFSTGSGLRGMASMAQKSTVPSLAVRLSF